MSVCLTLANHFVHFRITLMLYYIITKDERRHHRDFCESCALMARDNGFVGNYTCKGSNVNSWITCLLKVPGYCRKSITLHLNKLKWFYEI